MINGTVDDLGIDPKLVRSQGVWSQERSTESLRRCSTSWMLLKTYGAGLTGNITGEQAFTMVISLSGMAEP